MSHKGTKITVTEEDIKKGVRANQFCCPIARMIDVGDDGIFVDGKHFDQTEESSGFVSLFDSQQKLVPFKFKLGEDINDRF